MALAPLIRKSNVYGCLVMCDTMNHGECKRAFLTIEAKVKGKMDGKGKNFILKGA